MPIFSEMGVLCINAVILIAALLIVSLSALLAFVIATRANLAHIFKRLRTMSQELDLLKSQVTALVTAEQAAVANSDKLAAAISANSAAVAALQAQITDLQAKVASGSVATAADLQNITDQLAAATQALNDATTRDAAPAVP